MSTSDVSKTRAEAVITVHTYQPASCETPADGPSLVRIHVEEAFNGDIEGAGLRGEGGFRANLGENAAVHLDYWFD